MRRMLSAIAVCLVWASVCVAGERGPVNIILTNPGYYVSPYYAGLVLPPYYGVPPARPSVSIVAPSVLDLPDVDYAGPDEATVMGMQLMQQLWAEDAAEERAQAALDRMLLQEMLRAMRGR